MSSTERQVKAGRNLSDSQQYLCRGCGQKVTPEPRRRGYDEAARRKAIEIYPLLDDQEVWHEPHEQIQ